ncbi:HET-domain-containing protein [Karstenula rhodostoma CBS 690.94]|uniref:HET-domain-containing protein n=1 Tax=Karstenula rhodostoma CBS 690.94 TaxID=1392251 RepID=A0A9P4UEQ9_9PLEO|nr:HET-domain-containing protein [Karstenula rhodostoma CBS 690.94]
MICTTCYCMLRGQTGRQWRGTFDIHFNHHQTLYSLERSATMSCCICRIIWDELTEKYQGTKLAKVLQKNLRTSSNVDHLLELHRKQTDSERQVQFVRAFLSELQGGQDNDLYRLDFRLVESDSKRLATFLLEKSKNEPDSEIYTPLTDSTDSEEVLQLARFWLNRCLGPDHPECPNETFNDSVRLYPSRLLELPDSDDRGKPFGFLSKSRNGQGNKVELNEEEVRLVVTAGCRIRPYQATNGKDLDSRRNTLSSIRSPIENDSESQLNGSATPTNDRPSSTKLRVTGIKFEDDERPRGHYVTLSHCWGEAKFTKLTKENLEDFKKGIPLSSLPSTFRQAIHFARRLNPSIRYIWIDSLCIVQDSKDDWNRESVEMYSVYRNSYCNISATAASDSTHGMHFSRDPHHLWEDEINLNTEGIPRALDERVPRRNLGLEPLIRRCKIQDASFWDRQVDDAPVNRRAWVLQERLLAPRVLHFCKDQIAWECPHIDAAESYPYGVSKMELRAGTVGERTRLKALVPGGYGPTALAIGRTENAYAAHEDWKSIVERYSRTSLTKSNDKLIALAGIAELTSKRMGDRLIYVAGMWEKFLASQLLWYVEPKYEDEGFKYPQKRPDPKDPECWRAPTFSWAAVDAPQGIRCPETVREDDLQLSVQKIHVRPAFNGDFKFGAIASDCYIDIRCSLIEVEIQKVIGPPNEVIVDDGVERTVRYTWKVPGNDGKPIVSNLYLDSPHDDFEMIQRDGNVFCIPAHKKASGQLICLLVQLYEDGRPATYRRIGVADVPAFWTGKTFLMAAPTEETTIRLV